MSFAFVNIFLFKAHSNVRKKFQISFDSERDLWQEEKWPEEKQPVVEWSSPVKKVPFI